MQKINIGDIIICNDVLGAVVESTSNEYTILLRDGTKTKLHKNANIAIVANAYSIATLIYQKVLKKIRK